MGNHRDALIQAWPDILADVAAGGLVRDALAKRCIDRNVLSRWLAQDVSAKRQWDEAREASADALFDEAMVNARTDVDKELAQHVRTRIDTLKWAARIRNPRLYGDRSAVDVNVRTVDLTAIIRDANARLAASQQGRVIEHGSIAQGNKLVSTNFTSNNDELASAHTQANPAELLTLAGIL